MVWHVDTCPGGGGVSSELSRLSSGVVYRRLDQSRDDVLPHGAGELQSGGLGESSWHAGLQEPERRTNSGQLLVLSSVLVGEEPETHVQTGSAAAAQQVRGGLLKGGHSMCDSFNKRPYDVLMSFLPKGHDLWWTLTWQFWW